MKAIADLKLPLFVLDTARATAISGSLLSISGNARGALQEDPDIRTAVRLLQRVQRLPDGAFVRIHPYICWRTNSASRSRMNVSSLAC